MVIKNSLTEDDVNNAVAKEEVYTLGKKTTAIVLTLKNGYEIVGTSGCVDPANYDQAVGAAYARTRAMDKVWELLGFNLQQQLFALNEITEGQKE